MPRPASYYSFPGTFQAPSPWTLEGLEKAQEGAASGIVPAPPGWPWWKRVVRRKNVRAFEAYSRVREALLAGGDITTAGGALRNNEWDWAVAWASDAIGDVLAEAQILKANAAQAAALKAEQKT